MRKGVRIIYNQKVGDKPEVDTARKLEELLGPNLEDLFPVLTKDDFDDCGSTTDFNTSFIHPGARYLHLPSLEHVCPERVCPARSAVFAQPGAQPLDCGRQYVAGKGGVEMLAGTAATHVTSVGHKHGRIFPQRRYHRFVLSPLPIRLLPFITLLSKHDLLVSNRHLYNHIIP
jgi:hypothetical protein